MNEKKYETQVQQDKACVVIPCHKKIMSILPSVARVGRQLSAFVKTISVLDQRRYISSNTVLRMPADLELLQSNVYQPDARLGVSRRRPWTEDEKDTLRRGKASGLTHREIAALLPGRTVGTIAQRVYQLDGVNVKRHQRRRQHPDTKLIATLAAQGLNAEEIRIHHLPHMSIKNIRERAKIRGATYRRQDTRNWDMRRWTKAEDDVILKGKAERLSNQMVLDQLPGRSLTALESRINRLWVARTNSCPIRAPRRDWAVEEEQNLSTWYISGKPVVEIAIRLGRTVPSVRGAVDRLKRRQAQAETSDRKAD